MTYCGGCRMMFSAVSMALDRGEPANRFLDPPIRCEAEAGEAEAGLADLEHRAKDLAAREDGAARVANSIDSRQPRQRFSPGKFGFARASA
jgi:hypothetical protein